MIAPRPTSAGPRLIFLSADPKQGGIHDTLLEYDTTLKSFIRS